VARAFPGLTAALADEKNGIVNLAGALRGADRTHSSPAPVALPLIGICLRPLTKRFALHEETDSPGRHREAMIGASYSFTKGRLAIQRMEPPFLSTSPHSLVFAFANRLKVIA
jgi:hypothetical protein